jgi:hypothetical protein
MGCYIYSPKTCANSSIKSHGVSFIKVRAHGVKRRAQPNLGENSISWEQGANAWCQIRINLWKRMGAERKFKAKSINCSMKSTPEHSLSQNKMFGNILTERLNSNFRSHFQRHNLSSRGTHILTTPLPPTNHRYCKIYLVENMTRDSLSVFTICPCWNRMYQVKIVDYKISCRYRKDYY